MSTRRPPTDPNVAAHEAVSHATGSTEVSRLPSHITVSGDVATCKRCGKTYTLSKRANAHEEDLRAFAVLHRH